MMAVAAFMVHPGFAVTFFFTLCRIGAAGTLIVPGANGKFRRGILGKIVGQTLPVQTDLKAAGTNQPAVVSNGLKMLPCLHSIPSLSIYIIIPSRRKSNKKAR